MQTNLETLILTLMMGGEIVPPKGPTTGQKIWASTKSVTTFLAVLLFKILAFVGTGAFIGAGSLFASVHLLGADVAINQISVASAAFVGLLATVVFAYFNDLRAQKREDRIKLALRGISL